MTRARAPRRSTAAVAAIAAALGVLVVPLVLWVIAPALPGALESRDGFHWVGAEAGTGHPLLLRDQSDGRQIVAGSTRYGIPAGEAVACYGGDARPLRDAARAGGRIDDVTLRTREIQLLVVRFDVHVLTLRFDDLGGGATSFVYRCAADGARPLLSWGAGPGFGLRGFALAWLLWTVVWVVALSLVRRSATSRD